MKKGRGRTIGRMILVAVLPLMTTVQVFAQAEGESAGIKESESTLAPPDSNLLGSDRRNALGLDLMLSNSGFGLGGFYRRQYTPDISGFASFSISEVKDDREIEFFNPFTGEFLVPGKVNRFLLLPLFVGIQYRLFREEIADNFRPYVSGAVGPTMIYASPYEEGFFRSLGKGQAHYTLGGYVGFGAFFGTEQRSLVGLSFRYYFATLKNQLESIHGFERLYKKSFGGFFITLNVGTMY